MEDFRNSPGVWLETWQKHQKIICEPQVWWRWFWALVWYGWSEADLLKVKKGVWFPCAFFISDKLLCAQLAMQIRL